MGSQKQYPVSGSPVITVPIPANDLVVRMNDFYFASMYHGYFVKLRELVPEIIEFTHPSWADLKRVLDALRFLPIGSNRKKRADVINSKIRALLKLQTALITEGYQAFEALAKEFAKKDMQYCMELMSDSGFQEIRRLCKAEVASHPKIKKLLEIANGMVVNNQVGVIFVESNATASLLYDLLRQIDRSTELMIRPKKTEPENFLAQQHLDIARQLDRHELRFVVAHSQYQNILIPAKVDRYLQFSVPDPYRQKVVLQDRQEKGFNDRIEVLLLDHEIELQAYYTAYNKINFPKQYQWEQRQQRKDAKAFYNWTAMSPPRPTKKRLGKRPDPNQFNLFD